MVRDISERMHMFGVRDLEVEKVALTMAQVQQFKLSPDPAKVSDPRADAYIEKHGRRSWEVDAFKPDQITRIIEVAMQQHVDLPKYNAWIKKEQSDQAFLKRALKSRKPKAKGRR